MARVVVVGAGMAGLTAALRLSQTGHDVTVLEARHRLGGRVYSITLSNGEVAELGGEWLTSDQRWVVGLTEEVGVKLSPVGVDFTVRDLKGSPPISAAEHRRVADLVMAAVESLPDAERGQVTVDVLFRELDDGSDAFTVLRQRVEGSAGVSSELIGVDEIVGDFGIGEATYVRVDGGNQSLAEAVADQLQDVRTGQPVERIESTATGVSVATRNETFAVDGVVVAVPLPLISNLRFIPPLSRSMTAALGGLLMGTAAKLVAPTDGRPGLFALQDGNATWWCWTGLGADGKVRNVVTGFAGTQTAIDALAGNWRKRLVDALPEVRFGPRSAYVDWGQEQWSQGCYSALGPDDEALLAVFEESGRVVFAGEHTLGAGTIDGAIESGQAAAIRLGQYLTRSAQ